MVELGRFGLTLNRLSTYSLCQLGYSSIGNNMCIEEHVFFSALVHSGQIDTEFVPINVSSGSSWGTRTPHFLAENQAY